MITYGWICGHVTREAETSLAHCPICGESRLRSIKAPPPRFTGHALGPCATYRRLDAVAVPEAAPNGPLLRDVPTKEPS